MKSKVKKTIRSEHRRSWFLVLVDSSVIVNKRQIVTIEKDSECYNGTDIYHYVRINTAHRRVSIACDSDDDSDGLLETLAESLQAIRIDKQTTSKQVNFFPSK